MRHISGPFGTGRGEHGGEGGGVRRTPIKLPGGPPYPPFMARFYRVNAALGDGERKAPGHDAPDAALRAAEAAVARLRAENRRLRAHASALRREVGQLCELARAQREVYGRHIRRLMDERDAQALQRVNK